MVIIDRLKNKYNALGKPAKASFWYMFCNVVQKGIAFLVVPIYTRVLTLDEYGLYSTFQSWKEIILIFASLYLYAGVFTKAMVDLENDQKKPYTSSMQGLTTCLTLTLALIYFPLRSYINPFVEMDTITMGLLLLFCVFSPSINFWSVRQRVEYKYIKMILVTIGIALLVPAVSLILLYTTNLRTNAVIWGYLIVNIAVGLFFYIYNFIQGKAFFHKEYWPRALKYNIPLIPHYLSLIALGQSDKIMIQKLVGDAEVAIYSLAYQVSMLMIIVISAIDSALVPWEYENYKNKNYAKVASTCTKVVMVVGFLIVLATLISPELVYILGDKQYADAIWIIPAISISVAFIYIYGLFSTIEFYYSNTKFVMIASSSAAILNIILNYFCIKSFGYVAAAYTTLFCYFFLAVIHFIFSLVVKKKNGITEKIYDWRILSIIAVILVATIPGVLLLYKYMIARYIVLGSLVVLAIIFGRKIIRLFTNLKQKQEEPKLYEEN